VAKAHANEAAPPPPDEPFVTRMASIGVEAARFSDTLRVSTAVEAESPGLFEPDLPARTNVVGLWATMSCDRDPFSLRPGEVTAVQATIEFTIPASSPTLLSFQLRGDFRVDRMPLGLRGTRRVEGLLSGIGVTSHRIAGHESSHAGAFQRRVSIVFAEQANQPPSIDISIVPPIRDAVTWDLNLSWDGDPTVARAVAKVSLGDHSYTIPIGTFAANPDVLVTGNQTNTLARAGLAIVGAALQDPAFAESAEALLFPPPLVPAVELTVKPHRNWVLFRRPRTKQCAPDLVVAPPPAKHYDVFELAVHDVEHVTPVRNALWQGQNDVIARLAPRYVDRVEFAGGQGALNTSATQIRADWSAQHFPPIIQYAAIADAGQGEGALLARSRLTSLEQTLASVAQVDPNALAEALPTVPQSLVRAGADGVILLVTRPAEVKTTCMLVIRMNANAADFDPAEANVLSLVNEVLNPPQLMELVPPWHLLGKALFEIGGTQLTAGSAATLQQAWAKVGPQTPDPNGVLVFSKKGDPAAEPPLRHDRAVQLAQALGGPSPTPRIRDISAAVPGGCPAVAIVFRKG
jgi:hypothetical protein